MPSTPTSSKNAGVGSVDNRIPKIVRKWVEKLDFIAIPNLGALICGLALLGFFGTQFLGAPLERFLFDPALVREGEWWRLFAFPVSGQTSNPIWLLFYVLFIYFVVSALEAEWGSGPLTLFTLLSYLCAMSGAFLINEPVSIWYYVLENLSLAFGTLFPEVEFLLFFILPVKAKWLAMLGGGLLALQFLTASLMFKVFLLLALAPYLLFFGPWLLQTVKYRIRKRKERHRLDDFR